MDDQQPRIISRAPVRADDLGELREHAVELAHAAGLDDHRAEDFAIAISEITTNTIVHADGTGEILLYQDDATSLYAEVTDHGPGLPSAEAEQAPPCATGGRGLWITERMADAMHIESGPDGTTVRLDMTVGEEPDDH